jgi:uncharacterized protein YeaO (DUF488 family)
MTGEKREVRVRRIYDEPDSADGARVLVDRIWPRGMAKDRAALDEWAKDVAPSGELRRWYRHDPEHYADFARRYRAELAEPERAEALERLRELATSGPVTLLTATKNVGHSHATVLAEELSSPH